MLIGYRFPLTLASSLLCAAILHASAAADIEALQERWRAAMAAGDASTLASLYSDDLIYVHSDARIESKEAFLAPIVAGKMRLALSPCDTPRIRSYEESAVVSACYEIQGTKASSRHLFLTVWADQAGTWRIVTQQTTRVPERR